MKIKACGLVALTVTALGLAACGESKMGRGLSGAAIGAGAGAAAGALTGNVAGGALLGGAAGGAAGALTAKDDIDLGKPVWRR